MAVSSASGASGLRPADRLGGAHLRKLVDRKLEHPEGVDDEMLEALGLCERLTNDLRGRSVVKAVVPFGTRA